MSLLSRLQSTIENLYRIDGPPRVEDFRVGPGEVVELFGSKPDREALLVAHDGEHTDVGLYLDDTIAHEAARFTDGDGVDLDAFCAALEGVSHFVYFMYCGLAQARPVSLVELELQAEVDKFLLLRLFCTRPELVAELEQRLFVRFQLGEAMTSEVADRYRVANSEARRYARWLGRQIEEGATVRALDDARALYRKPLADKLEHIARAA